MTDIITLKDGDLPRGFVEEVRICKNCKHHKWNNLCKRHVSETEGGLFMNSTSYCEEWREI